MTIHDIIQAAALLEILDPVTQIDVSPRVFQALLQHVDRMAGDNVGINSSALTIMGCVPVCTVATVPDHLYIEHHADYWLLKSLVTGKVRCRFDRILFNAVPLEWVDVLSA